MRRWTRPARGLKLLAALCGTAIVAAVGVFAYAQIPSSNGTITACVKRTGGVLRVIDASRSCRRGEKRLRLNQRGRRGRRGPAGPAGVGTPGAPGASGAPGNPGAPGQPGKDAGTVVNGGDCGDIQVAIDGLPSGGGAVLVRPGTYACANALRIDRDNVTLRGSGPATILKLGANVNRPVLLVGQPIPITNATRRHVRVSDLSVDGNKAQQQFECHLSDGCAGADVLRNNGITLRTVEDVAVERVRITAARSGGLVVERNSRRVTIRDIVSTGNHFDGVAAAATTQTLFTGLQLYDNDRAGLSFDLDFNDNLITDSVIADNADVGVFMRQSRRNLFSALEVRNNGSSGLFLAEHDDPHDPNTRAADNTFDGLVVSGSGQDAGRPGFGIRVNDASCSNNLVVATQFIGNRQAAVSEASPGLVQEFGTIHQ